MGEVNLLRHVFRCGYLSSMMRKEGEHAATSAAWRNAGGAVELPIITS